MTNRKDKSHQFARVYGVYPCTGGFAFAVVEVRARLVDWGKIDLGIETDKEFGARLADELERSKPWAVATEVCENTNRQAKARRRVGLARNAARQFEIECLPIDRRAIRICLGLSRMATRHDVAEELCRVFPELAHRLPKRSIWKRDPRIHLFMALSLAWAAASQAAA